jgi:hypothetical protein
MIRYILNVTIVTFVVLALYTLGWIINNPWLLGD